MTAALRRYPMARGCPTHRPEPYARLRTEEPIREVATPEGGRAGLVTSYADVRALLTDPRVSSSRSHPNLPSPIPVTPEIRRESARVADALLRLDLPSHTVPELEVVFSRLFERLPGLRLAVPMSELPFKDDANVYGIHLVPVARQEEPA